MWTEEWISDVETAEEGRSSRSDAWNPTSDYKSWWSATHVNLGLVHHLPVGQQGVPFLIGFLRGSTGLTIRLWSLKTCIHHLSSTPGMFLPNVYISSFFINSLVLRLSGSSGQFLAAEKNLLQLFQCSRIQWGCLRGQWVSGLEPWQVAFL